MPQPRCLFCGLASPDFFKKHKTKCFYYNSIEPERCAIQHDWFLRSCGGGDPYKYECNFCNRAPILCDSELEFPPHAFCKEGKHRFSGRCYTGCCPSSCRCGGLEDLYN